MNRPWPTRRGSAAGQPAVREGASGRDRLLSIQFLRAVAALSVCADHFNAVSLMVDGRAGDAPVLHPLAAGVDLFFVISGFVIVHSSERLFGHSKASVIFLGRRLARIVPLYWVVTAIGIYAESKPFDVSSLVKSYLFIPFLSQNGKISPLYGVGWTLNYEMFFYVLFAVAIVLPRGAAVIATSCALIGAVAIGGLFPEMPTPLRFWSDPIVVEFVFGMVLAIAYRRGLHVPRWAGTATCLAGAIIIWHSVPHHSPSGDRWLACGVPAMLIFAGLVFQGPLPRVLRFTAALGDASYAIYLLHGIVLSSILIAWPIGLNIYPKNAVLAAGLLVTVLLSLAVYRWFERPLTRYLRNGAAAPATGVAPI